MGLLFHNATFIYFKRLLFHNATFIYFRGLLFHNATFNYFRGLLFHNATLHFHFLYSNEWVWLAHRSRPKQQHHNTDSIALVSHSGTLKWFANRQ